MKEFDKHFKSFEDVGNKKLAKNIEFGWVNATCQTGFSAHFNAEVDNLPGAIAILPEVDKYAIMFGSFEHDNILSFVERVLNGKMPLDTFDNEKIYLRNSINCFEIQEEEFFESDREDYAILKEIKEEAVKKRIEFEEERKKLLNKDDL